MIGKKTAVFTDIHFGRRNNDRQANQDNEEFIDWLIDESRTWGADSLIFCGDWSDNRHTIQVATMNSSLKCLEKLAAAFDKVFMVLGNHDLFFREKRDLNSIEFGHNIDNVILIKDPVTLDDVTFLPWLVGDEHKRLKNLKSRYVFGHLEMPGFMMNANVEMPDHGGINANSFPNQELTISGHFHLRQHKGNVLYMGNAFPFTYSDAWNDDRGLMLLERGKDPQFRAWPDQPVFRTMRLSELADNPARYLRAKASARVTVDIDINFEEAQFLRDTLMAQYGARKIDLIHQQNEEAVQEYDGKVAFQSIDQMVIDGLNAVESVGLKKEMLIDLYRGLA